VKAVQIELLGPSKYKNKLELMTTTMHACIIDLYR
jgi:hypothetical protein